MATVYRPLLVLVIAASLLIVSGASATGRVTKGETSEETIAVRSPRPLADVVKALQERLGVVITYEDPPYLHSSQIRDATAEFRPGAPPTARRTFIPRGGPFSFSYETPSGTPDEQATSILENLVQQYQAKGYGSFQIEKAGRVFHVVPTERRSRDGRDEAYQPILSATLQVDAAQSEQSALAAVEDLVATLGRTARARVVLMTIPSNLLNQTTATAEAGTRTVREELVRILAATGRQLSWLLYFDPNEPAGWYLNITVVR